MSASVSVVVNSRSYSIACEEGQEDRVLSLGQYIDKRVKDIAGAGAAHNESQLMVLTSLVLTDEIFELQEELALLKNQMADAQNAGYEAKNAQECIAPEELENMRKEVIEQSMQREAEIAFSISEIADDIQGLAKRLQSV